MGSRWSGNCWVERHLPRAYSEPLVRKFTICGLVVVSLALAACGGDGDDGVVRADDGTGAGTDVIPGGTYVGDGYSFSYPATWTALEPEGLGVGSEVTPESLLAPRCPPAGIRTCPCTTS